MLTLVNVLRVTATIPQSPAARHPPLTHIWILRFKCQIQGEFGELEYKPYQTFNTHCVCFYGACSMLLRVFSEREVNRILQGDTESLVVCDFSMLATLKLGSNKPPPEGVQ